MHRLRRAEESRIISAQSFTGLLLLLGYGATAHAQRIAAASDLRAVLDPLIAQYQVQHPHAKVQVSYGSSGQFATQILSGAPFDIFLSADAALVAQIKKKADDAPVVTLGRGRLALVARQGDAACTSIAALIEKNNQQKIAIANPEHAPYGARAKEILLSAQVWSVASRQQRIVLADNVSSALSWVTSGAAPVGLVAWIQADLLPRAQYCVVKIPAAQHSPLIQQGIRLRASPSTDAFWAWLSAPQVLAQFHRAGLRDD